MAHIPGDWQLNEAITPEILNGYDADHELALNAIPYSDFTRAPAYAVAGGAPSALTAIVTGFVPGDGMQLILKVNASTFTIPAATQPTLAVNGGPALPIFVVSGTAGEKRLTGAMQSSGWFFLVCNSTGTAYYCIGLTDGVALANAAQTAAINAGTAASAAQTTANAAMPKSGGTFTGSTSYSNNDTVNRFRNTCVSTTALFADAVPTDSLLFVRG